MTFFAVLFPHISRSIKPSAYKTFKCFFVSGWLHFCVILGSNQLDKLHSLFFVTIVHIKFHHHKPSWGPHLSTVEKGEALSSLQGRTLPKAQGTQGLSSAHQSNFVRLYQVLTQIFSTKHQLQNLNQTSGSRLNLKLRSCPNLASEFWPRFNCVTSTDVSSKTLTKLQLQNLAWTSTSKSRPKCSKSNRNLYGQTSASKSATNCFKHNSHH